MKKIREVSSAVKDWIADISWKIARKRLIYVVFASNHSVFTAIVLRLLLLLLVQDNAKITRYRIWKCSANIWKKKNTILKYLSHSI